MKPVSSDLKLKRAQVHLESLKLGIDAFLRTNPYDLSIERDVVRQEHIVRMSLADGPLDLAPVAGDFVHNLRGSLDNLAWRLAVVSTNKSSDRVSFPICETNDSKARKTIKRCAEGIAPEAVAILESLQPYHEVRGYTNSHLWRLNKLWNIDKHRHLVFESVAVPAQILNVPLAAKPNCVFEASDDGHVVRIPFTILAETSEVQTRVDELEISFGDDEVAVTLADFQAMCTYVVDEVFPLFQRFI